MHLVDIELGARRFALIEVGGAIMGFYSSEIAAR